MKAQIAEKNGFPKPLGMLLIIILLGLTCFFNLVFADDSVPAAPEYLTEDTIESVSEPMDFDAFRAFPYKISLFSE